MIFANELKAVLSQINDVSDDDAKTPTISTGILIQEAFNLYAWMQPDLDELKKYGMPPQLPNNVLLMAKACAEIQAKWFTVHHGKSTEQKVWEVSLNKALALRNELIRIYSFAFRLDKSLMNTINEVKKGSGDPDLIMDIRSLIIIGKRGINLLNKVGFNTDYFTQAQSLVDVMSLQLAKAAMGDKTHAKLLRNKAMFRLQLLITEIRSFGKFAFKNNPERFEGYKQQYKRRKKASTTKI